MKKPCNCLPPPPRPKKGPSEYIPSKTYPDPLVGAPGYISMHHGRGPCGCSPFVQVPDPNIHPPRPEPVPPEPSPECNCPPKIYRSRAVEVVAGDNIKVDTKDTSDGTEFTVHAPEFNGADARNDGTSGTVPAPKAGDENRVLTGGGVWAEIEIPEQVQADWAEENEEELSFILNKPELAEVATSGSYNDLEDKPEIPAAQVQTDWNQADDTQPDFLKNKPGNFQGATENENGTTGFVPAPLIADRDKYLKGDGTWGEIVIPEVPRMSGATASTNGEAGIVPAPVAGDQNKYLSGDGTWKDVEHTRACRSDEIDTWLEDVDNEVNNG